MHWPSEPCLKLPAYTRSVMKANKSFKGTTISYTNKLTTLYLLLKQKHPKCKKRSSQELKGPC